MDTSVGPHSSIWPRNQQELAGEAPLAHFCPFGSQASARVRGWPLQVPEAGSVPCGTTGTRRGGGRWQDLGCPIPRAGCHSVPMTGNHGKQPGLLGLLFAAFYSGCEGSGHSSGIGSVPGPSCVCVSPPSVPSSGKQGYCFTPVNRMCR